MISWKQGSLERQVRVQSSFFLRQNCPSSSLNCPPCLCTHADTRSELIGCGSLIGWCVHPVCFTALESHLIVDVALSSNDFTV